MRLTMGEERVVCRGMRYEENPWGAYQFPHPYKVGDKFVVSVHNSHDDIKHFTEDALLWYESSDDGVTWTKTDSSVIKNDIGLLLENGDRIFFPVKGGIDVSDYEIPIPEMKTPGTDMKAKAEEGTFPIQDGITWNLIGTFIRGYLADRLPDSLSAKEWDVVRIPAGETEPVYEKALLDWPYLTRVLYYCEGHMEPTLRPLFPHGRPRIGPDGAIWVSTYSGDCHIDPSTEQFSPYYSAQIFRSEDNGKTFKLWSNMEYEADGKKYPYLNGGFSDSDFEFMPDGSIVWFLRSAWFGYTGNEVDPMYVVRSEDNGKTWTKPEVFANMGIYPRLCKLNCGTTLLVYARPGVFVTASEDESGTKWCEPLEVMTPGDRSHLHNLKIEKPRFHDWDGACNNPTLIALDDNSALLFYSDFYYPDEFGVKRKTILCRKITVVE